MHSETSSHSRQRNDDWMHTVPEIEVHRKLKGYAWNQWLGIASSPYSDSYLHSSKLSRLNVRFQDSLFELHSWWESVHIIYFPIQVLAAQTYQSVRTEFSRHSKHWELRYLWVSAGHGCVGVAGQLAESLNRICLLWFSLWSSSSCVGAQTCRSYFRISKHWSKHTT